MSRSPSPLPFRLRQTVELLQSVASFSHPQPLNPPQYIPGQRNYFVYHETPENMRKVISSTDTGSDLIYPDESYDVMMVANAPFDRPNALAQLLADYVDSNNCINVGPSSPLVQYYPQNPYTNPNDIPLGYFLPPFYISNAATQIAYGVPPGYPVTSFDRLWSGAPLPPPGGEVPRIRLNVVGPGTVGIHLLNLYQGGIAQIDTDEHGPEFIDLNQDITSIPIETEDRTIVERTFTGSGPHYVDVRFLAVVDNSSIPIYLGGGVEKFTLCEFTDMELLMTQTRLNGCTLEQSFDDGTTWQTVGSFIPQPNDCTWSVDFTGRLKNGSGIALLNTVAEAPILRSANTSYRTDHRPSDIMYRAMFNGVPASAAQLATLVSGTIDTYTSDFVLRLWSAASGLGTAISARNDGEIKLGFLGASPVARQTLPVGTEFDVGGLLLANALENLGLIEAPGANLKSDPQYSCIMTGKPDYRIVLSRSDDDGETFNEILDLTSCISAFLTARDAGFPQETLALEVDFALSDVLDLQIGQYSFGAGYQTRLQVPDYAVIAGTYACTDTPALVFNNPVDFDTIEIDVFNDTGVLQTVRIEVGMCNGTSLVVDDFASGIDVPPSSQTTHRIELPSMVTADRLQRLWVDLATGENLNLTNIRLIDRGA